MGSRTGIDPKQLWSPLSACPSKTHDLGRTSPPSGLHRTQRGQLLSLLLWSSPTCPSDSDEGPSFQDCPGPYLAAQVHTPSCQKASHMARPCCPWAWSPPGGGRGSLSSPCPGPRADFTALDVSEAMFLNDTTGGSLGGVRQWGRGGRQFPLWGERPWPGLGAQCTA